MWKPCTAGCPSILPSAASRYSQRPPSSGTSPSSTIRAGIQPRDSPIAFLHSSTVACLPASAFFHAVLDALGSSRDGERGDASLHVDKLAGERILDEPVEQARRVNGRVPDGPRVADTRRFAGQEPREAMRVEMLRDQIEFLARHRPG